MVQGKRGIHQQALKGNEKKLATPNGGKNVEDKKKNPRAADTGLGDEER